MKLTTRRTVAVTVLIGSMTLTMTACNRESPSAGGKDGKNITFALSTLNNPFFVDVRDGAQEAAKKAGATLNVVDAQNDAATQANQMSDTVTKKPAAVIINPVDSDAAGAAVKPVINAKIPVVAADRGVNGAEVNSLVSSDNVAGGKQAAEALAKAVGEKGEILVLQGVAGTSASRDRGQGFEEGIKAFPNIKVVSKQPANFDRTQGLNVTTNLLQSNPNIVGIFTENDEMALGAIQALGEKAGSAVKVVGFDGTADGLKAVKAGTMAATVAQQPKLLGEKAIELAMKLAKGEKVDKSVPVPVKTVETSNVDEFLK
ncbi:ribose transport system substrate-binding protein [Austwickia chelonae]|uniref:Ribose ABC transporter substrate-binding protein n=1 Tax=Austwickia chelonae NBRC 105200 TaxID=1184607 RepID=K6VPG1_9MICO|nr:D-ribose ABC transporter substrate-binding protein [Austwickia chelonae]GAB78604.1 ribose ABC transporter substrate-binding protein precursor [Austwickia chelonae NBRC 105200]SEW34060.1 ribose transport system substrate-binding protein [Austwickia chelonae]